MKMFKKIKLKSTTRMTIFSTALLTAIIAVFYVFMLSEINADMRSKGLDFDYASFNPSAGMPVFFMMIAILAFTASSLMVDKMMNPIRQMIPKVRDVGNMKFSEPLVIHSDDDELREYVAAFNNMSQKLSGYIERQKRFISDASHELATPVTVINGHADLLLRHGKEQPELIDAGLRIIKSEVLRMDALVDSLLLLARSDSGRQKYIFERTDLSKLITEATDEAKFIAPEFAFETDIENNIVASCDEYAIRRVMRILFSNAVKYSKGTEATDRRIEVNLSVSHGLAKIVVRDNGIGIAQEHLPLIFGRFYRVDESRSKKTGSSGLGLSIAWEIVSAHGGEIQAASALGEWTEFTVTLSM